MTDKMELKAHITAMLVVHGRTVSDGFRPAREAMTVQKAAELAAEIVETSARTHFRRS